jgi:hypothetical protein
MYTLRQDSQPNPHSPEFAQSAPSNQLGCVSALLLFTSWVAFLLCCFVCFAALLLCGAFPSTNGDSVSCANRGTPKNSGVTFVTVAMTCFGALQVFSDYNQRPPL